MNPLARLRNPAYTGENRCVPCTAVNVAISVVAAAVAAVAAVELAAAVLAVSLSAIYLRGYLVPGTPTLTKRYFPPWLLARFGKDPRDRAGPTRVERADGGSVATGTSAAETSTASTEAATATPDEDAEETDAAGTDVAGTDADESDESDADDDPGWDTIERLERERAAAVDPEPFLAETGVTVSPGGTLTDVAVERIRAAYDAVAVDGVDDATLAAMLGADEATRLDRDRPAVRAGVMVHEWPSRTAFEHDVATHLALGKITDRWSEVPPDQRRNVLKALRSHREACPNCGAAPALDSASVDSCCYSHEVAILGCEGCGDRLLEFDPAAAADADDAAALRVSPADVFGN